MPNCRCPFRATSDLETRFGLFSPSDAAENPITTMAQCLSKSMADKQRLCDWTPVSWRCGDDGVPSHNGFSECWVQFPNTLVVRVAYDHFASSSLQFCRELGETFLI